MPTQLINQPFLNRPNAKNSPLRWDFLTNEHVVNVGRKLTVGIAFGNPTTPGVFVAANDGDTVILRGIIFTVDNSTPYTQSTFRANISSEDTARNCAEMLKLNYSFSEYSIYVKIDSASLQWSVFLESYEKVTYDNMNPLTDWDALNMTAGSFYGFSILNGLPPVLKKYKLWYRVFDSVGPVSSVRYTEAPFLPNYPFVSLVRVDATKVARGLVKTTRPDIFQSSPLSDETYQRLVYLKFGNVELNGNCEAVYGEVYQTAQVMYTNAVFQLEETSQWFPHAPNGNLGIKFLTNRPDNLTVCGYSYEWAHIWIEKGTWKTAPFKVQYKFYDSSNGLIRTTEQNIVDATGNYRKAWQIAVGTANLHIRTNINGANYYTIQVIGTRILENGTTQDTPYSNLLTRIITSCNCKAAEIYFLEDRGSWRTVIFEKLEARETRQTDIEYERELDWSDNLAGYLYNEGGTYNEAQLAESVFILISERITEYNRNHYEQLIRSQEMYILSKTETGREVIRRIFLERTTFRTFESGVATRLIVSFRFNTKLQLQ